MQGGRPVPVGGRHVVGAEWLLHQPAVRLHKSVLLQGVGAGKQWRLLESIRLNKGAKRARDKFLDFVFLKGNIFFSFIAKVNS